MCSRKMSCTFLEKEKFRSNNVLLILKQYHPGNFISFLESYPKIILNLDLFSVTAS